MPYINVKITKGATQEQKELIIQGATQLMVDVLNKDPKTTFVVIDEVNTDDWGIGGTSISKLLQQKK
jgi:4-oxalocrotonate tautomerase